MIAREISERVVAAHSYFRHRTASSELPVFLILVSERIFKPIFFLDYSRWSLVTSAFHDYVTYTSINYSRHYSFISTLQVMTNGAIATDIPKR
jgi:hypothetical protein